jgi:hypothetical protein
MDPSPASRARRQFVDRLQKLVRRERLDDFDSLVAAYFHYIHGQPTDSGLEEEVESIFRHLQAYPGDFYRRQQYRSFDSDRLDDIRRELAVIRSELTDLKEHDVDQDTFVGSLLGIGDPQQSRRQVIAIRAYIPSGSPDVVMSVSAAISRLLYELDFDLLSYRSPIAGSWFQTWMAATRRLFSRREVSSRLERIERAIEVQQLQKPISESDKLQMDGAAQLIQALQPEKEAAIHIGSLLLLKQLCPDGHSRIIAKSLTARQILTIERDEQLLMAGPADILQRLNSSTKNTNHDTNEG